MGVLGQAIFNRFYVNSGCKPPVPVCSYLFPDRMTQKNRFALTCFSTNMNGALHFLRVDFSKKLSSSEHP